ncbi:cytochrome P450 [Mycolicibacterium fortuitum subsp. fortuitum DSM 46621 = ATCC 6841 = JCM 6387]|uniref:Steroid C26-monooxygenase n=1 Tax=Mycolicibacterium fortuitum subsp. fortuitum DSM 46621 = ATCC 6841 = JCM 6387 TaxID=1214102 RepID=K0UTE8_MYCFO|nr:cytochrome P450 [Mycolicibacterium fortuitum]CRL80642.1 cytochrome P450 [Mycolicibacter nonchromogenicus]AMD54213.1 cytochrome [Mycolicibacterium fortuitum subsp. fortuitum DSM 46621 = ATCC 6841 = JCM 6387]EJZ10046.1 cytochrome P450 [Mycolicibacterium fortuitum subsp. fortuitum DSM 46621 = ATCC 6841 = JCM 6387]CRL56741.1 cytochrome P450 [Mycolicibacterium fortuitum subsp. fortuitum DSM 46621 = ATCC 6841 = JCM 6387]BDD97368.1 cytochrome P450 [Mycolicibacterium fortuitum subsp. fortuitum]
MSAPTMDDAAKVLADPTAYADDTRLHRALTHLRANNPVAWVDNRPYRPFWAITKHADIMAIERDNELFISEPRPLLATAAADDLAKQQLEAGMGLRTLIHMDDPHHRKVRAIGADWFRPKAMRALKVRVDELAKRYVDKMRDIGPECDFVTAIAVDFPLYVIMSLLGLPEEDFARMHMLTQEMFGGDDDEYKRDGGSLEDQLAVLMDFFAYFSTLTASRRANPTEDLASAIANGTVDGEPLSDVDTASYYVIVASAGHDTTKDAISGGLHALIENPDQLARLQAQPDLMGTAVEEMIRWSTPVKEFMRTATADTTVRGVPIAKGESVYLAYVSGNRDEEVFANPHRFDVARDPNKHLAFGYGVHFCLGAALARMEMNSLFAELLSRLDSIELAGTPELSATTFVGGLKHLPIRYSLR